MTQDPNRLRTEILNEAKRQSEAILKSARDAADRVMAEAEQTARQARETQLKAATAEGIRRREAILSTVVVETKRLTLRRTEELLNELQSRVKAQLLDGNSFNLRQALIEQAATALGRMHGNGFLLRLSPADMDHFSQDLANAIHCRAKRVGVRLDLRGDPEVADGAWILQDDEGQQQWRLGLEARLARLWPELRRQVAAQLGLGDDTNAKPEEGA